MHRNRKNAILSSLNIKNNKRFTEQDQTHLLQELLVDI